MFSSRLYLQREITFGGIAGPCTTSPLPNLHPSHFGVIPKKNQPGKWWLTLDLSSTDSHSVNDGIPKSPFSEQYITVDDLTDSILERGGGTLMAKFDVDCAYWNMAV